MLREESLSKKHFIGLAAAGMLCATALLATPGLASSDPLAPAAGIVSSHVVELTAASTQVDVIITFDQRPRTYYPELLESLLGDLGETFRYELTSVVTATVTTEQLVQLESLSSKFGITSITYNRPLRASDLSAATTGAPIQGAAGFTGAGTTIAILDTGVDIGHESLDEGKVVAFYDTRGGNWSGCAPHSTGTSYDDDPTGHGTHVASTAAGNGSSNQGVAPDASIVSVKVLDCVGEGYEADINEGVAWILENRDNFGGIDVASISIQGAPCSPGSSNTGGSLDSLAAGGIVIVAAAGNEGPDYCSVTFPGNSADAITVGAVDSAQTIADFSGRGPTLLEGGIIKPDLAAPGVGIVAAQVGTFSGYSAKSGTSMATPYVAGVALLMLESAPDASVDDVRAALTSTAIDAGPIGRDNTFGYGIVDPSAAISALSEIFNPSPTPTPTPTPTPVVHIPSGSSNTYSRAALDPLEPGPGAVRVRGWSFDPDLPTFPQVVHVYAFYDGSATPVALDTPVVRAATPRPDVNRALNVDGDHGFNRRLAIRPGTHKVCVYSISVDGTGATDGLNRLINCRTVTITAQAAPRGVVDNITRVGNSVIVNGWAYDLDIALSSVDIHVYIDGRPAASSTANRPRPDVNQILSIDGDHGFTTSVPIGAGPHEVCVYVIGLDPTGSPDGDNRLLTCQTV